MNKRRAYKTELDPNNAQATAFRRNIAAGRFVYNWALEDRKRCYEETGKGVSIYAQKRYFNAIKGECFPWLLAADYKVTEQAFANLDLAFQNFFRRVKRGETPGYPRFKSRHAPNQSYITRGSVHIEADRVQLPKIGWVRLKERGYLPEDGECKLFFVTISERAGRWYISAQVEEQAPDPIPPTGDPLGVDVGINKLAVCSDGSVYENPRALEVAQRKLGRLNRELSRRTKGGANWRKTKAQLARQHERVANIRKHAQHQASHEIIAHKQPRAVVLESLNVKGMLQNGKLAKALSDAGMGELHRQLRYKAAWRGVEVVAADAWYASTKTCSGCGSKKPMALGDRVYICPECGLVMDRDVNAAMNLAGLAGVVDSTPCGVVQYST
jgi:putative transposase